MDDRNDIKSRDVFDDVVRGRRNGGWDLEGCESYCCYGRIGSLSELGFGGCV